MIKWTIEEMAEILVKAVATFPKTSLSVYSSQYLPYEIHDEEVQKIRHAYYALAQEYNLVWDAFADRFTHGWYGKQVSFYNGPLGQIMSKNWPHHQSESGMGIYYEDGTVTITPQIPYGSNLAAKNDKSRKLAEQLGEIITKISDLKVVIPQREKEDDLLSGFEHQREFYF